MFWFMTGPWLASMYGWKVTEQKLDDAQATIETLRDDQERGA